MCREGAPRTTKPRYALYAGIAVGAVVIIGGTGFAYARRRKA